MSDVLDVVVIGAGWAGLGVSHGLTRSGISHVILERGRIGETWRSQRWDSFHFNVPRVLTVLPGDRYEGTDPEGAMTRDEFVVLLEDYASRNSLPVHTGEPVAEVAVDGVDGRYVVRTPRRTLVAPNVVVASGSLNRPRRPAISAAVHPSIRQIDASEYRSAAQLEAGAVLVVGCGQSGGQIAKDLADANRSVFVATGKVGRTPRRYRGRDFALWVVECGLLDVRREDFVLPSGAVPARGLQGALETLSLQSLSAQGVVLLGRLKGADSTLLTFTDDVEENVRFADANSAEVRRKIDDYIARAGISAPAPVDDPAETVPPRIPFPPITSLDLASSGISTIIWCTGFDGDFNWLKVPGTLGPDQQPLQVNSMAAAEGIYFAGLDFASTRKSGTILASVDESRAIVGHIQQRLRELKEVGAP